MRLLFLARALSVGGAERQLVVLARALAARGHTVTIATMYPGGALEAELAGSGVSLRDLGKRRRWEAAGVLWRLRALIRELRPEIVHGYLTVPNLLALTSRMTRDRPLVVFGLRASGMSMASYNWLLRVTHGLEGLLASGADLAIVNSEAGQAAALRRGFRADRLFVIPNGIDLARFRPDAAARARARAAWGIPEDTPVIGHVGRIDPMKDHGTFLAAMADLAARGSQARAVIVASGDAAARSRLAAAAAGLGLGDHVLFRPPEADLTAMYNGFDIFCSSSAWGEGFPNVVAEAMACGTPAVVTEVGDSSRLVAGSGRVVPAADPAALAAALEAALGEGTAPRAMVRSHIADHSVERLAERTEAVLAAALATRS